jgi:hypothetical protein
MLNVRSVVSLTSLAAALPLVACAPVGADHVLSGLRSFPACAPGRQSLNEWHPDDAV